MIKRISKLCLGLLMATFTFTSCEAIEGIIGGKDPHEHTWTAGAIVTEATCTEDGKQTYNCECGETKEEAIPATGHSYATTWSKDDNQHWYECACGDKSETADHAWVAGDIIEEATCTVDGSQAYSCACGATKTETITAPGHSYATTWTVGETQHWYECACGDKSEIADHAYTETKYDETNHWTECICGAKANDEAEHWTAGNYNETQHWEECECGYATTAEDHVLDEITTTETQHSYACACGYAKDPVDHIWVEGETVAPTCTATGYTPYSCECGQTKQENPTDKLRHTNPGFEDVLCDVCGNTYYLLDGDTVPSVSYVLKYDKASKYPTNPSATAQVYLTGYIVEVTNSTAGTFKIADTFDTAATDKVQVSSLVDENGAPYSEWTTKLVLGDKITVYGTMNRSQGIKMPNSSSTQTVQLISKEHTHAYSEEASCFEARTCACMGTTGEPNGHTDADSNGYCEVCGCYTASVAEKIVMNYDNRTEGTNMYSWASNGFTVEILKGTSSSKLNTNGASEHVRLNKGNYMEVTAAEGKLIYGFKITIPGTSYAANWETILTNAGYTVTKSILGLEVRGFCSEGKTTVTLPNATASMRLSGIEIYYA